MGGWQAPYRARAALHKLKVGGYVPLRRHVARYARLLSHPAAYLDERAARHADQAFSSVHCNGCWFWRAKSMTCVTFVSAIS